MLAYRHAFHAGNHADVLEAPGADARAAPPGREGQGLPLRRHPRRRGRLLAARPLRAEERRIRARHRPALDARRPAGAARRLRRAGARASTPTACSRQYPGSPALAQMLLRAQDELRAFELHPTEQKILRATLAGNRRATVYDGDGFVGLRAQVPPPIAPRRGADRPELRGQRRLRQGRRQPARGAARASPTASTSSGTRRSARSRRRSCRAAWRRSRRRRWLHARLTVQEPDAQGFGLAGSGVFVINPPHTLHATAGGDAALSRRRARPVSTAPTS